MTEHDRHQPHPTGDGREVPPAPRSPLRDDEPAAPMKPIPGAQDPGPGGAPARDDRDDLDLPPVTATEPTQDDASRDLQEENAETSLDQPST